MFVEKILAGEEEEPTPLSDQVSLTSANCLLEPILSVNTCTIQQNHRDCCTRTLVLGTESSHLHPFLTEWAEASDITRLQWLPGT